MRCALAALWVAVATSGAASSACGRAGSKASPATSAEPAPTGSAVGSADAGSGGTAGYSAGPQELVNVGGMSVNGLAVADEWVYFTSRGFVWRVNKDTPTTVTYAELSAQAPVAPWDGFPWPKFAVTSTHVCWPDLGDVTCLPRSGGELVTVALDGAVSQDSRVGTDGTDIFVVEPGCTKVVRVGPDLTITWIVVAESGGSTTGAAVLGDTDSVYCVGDKSVVRLLKGDGAATVIASGFRDGGPVAQSSSELFWLAGNRTTPPQALLALAKGDLAATPREVASSGDRVGSSGALLFDAARARLYWSRFNTIVSAPAAGGPLTEIAAEPVQIRSVAADESSLYWATFDSPLGISGRVMKLPKPAN